MSDRRDVGTGLLGMAVLVAVMVFWWFFSGNGPTGARDPAFELPTEATAPVSPGASTPPLRTIPFGLPLVSWTQDGTTLTLTYRRGDDGCFGALDTPRVRESDVAVTITLLRETGSPQRCPFTTTGTVRVDLDAPVGQRSVLDGSYDARRVLVDRG